MIEKHTPENLALHSNASRQAADSIRGYAFQIWHSIHTWLDLGPEEFLFLEGAEDIDVVSLTSATAIQVKDTSANITLRSPAVVDAINHFWELREKHPDQTVKFRFLTRSDVGIEQGTSFGTGVGGIEIWKRCSKDVGLVEQIRAFLLREKRVSTSLLAFLAGANNDQVFRELIDPMTWDTKTPDMGYVEQAVNRQLAYYGKKFGILYSDAIAVSNRLLREALSTAAKKDHRVLDHTLFLQLFEETTTERVPNQELRRLRAVSGETIPRPVEPNIQELSRTGQLQIGMPPMPPKAAARTELTLELFLALEKIGLLVLNGSSGMGKTTLAKLVAQQNNERWVWVGLSQRDRAQTTGILLWLSNILDQEKTLRHLIIDDIDLSPPAARYYEEQLGGLIYTIKERGGSVIITSQKPLTGSLNRGLDANPLSTRTVPPFTEKEVAQLAVSIGCPDPALASKWARIVRLKTSGHPQLVHAHLLNLTRRKWPAPSTRDLVQTPDEVVKERAETRQELVEQLAAEERELLYRLSLLVHPFRKDHAVAIAEQPSELVNGGDIFDRLVGPWIEIVGDEYYRVSPLLDDAVSEVRSKQKIEELHASISQAIINCQPLTSIEGGSILYHAFFGNCIEVLVRLLLTLPSAPGEVLDPVAQSTLWFQQLHLGNGEVLFPQNHALSVMLRAFQFRLAAIARPNIASRIVKAWEVEIIPGKAGELYDSERMMLVSTVLVYFQAELPAQKVIQFFKELSELEKRISVPEPASMPFPGILPISKDSIEQLALMLVPRCVSVEFLDNLLDNLDGLDAGLRDRILTGIQASPSLGRSLIDKPWVAEADKANPDWPKCIGILRKAAKLALKWNAPGIGIGAIRAIAIVTDEYQHQQEAALHAMDELMAETGFASVLLEDARATVLFHQDKFAEALEIWERILPVWPAASEKYDALSLFACRIAAVAASRLGNWEKAAQIFMEGHSRAKTLDNAESAVGLISDAGYAWWKAGRNLNAVKAFVEALSAADLLSDSRDDLAAYKVKRLLGHVLYWIANTVTGESTADSMPPQAGICSDPEPREKMRELPDVNPEAPWLLLGVIESRLQTGVDVNTPIKRRLTGSSLSAAPMLLAEAEMKTAFQNLVFGCLPTQCMKLTREFCVLRETHPDAARFRSGNSSPDPDAFHINDARIGSDVFFDALVALAGTMGIDSEIFQAWRRDAAMLPARNTLFVLFELMERFIGGEHAEAVKGMRKERSRIARMVCALRVATSGQATADQLFYAETTLLETLPHDGWIKECAEAFAQLFAKQWLQQTEFRAGLRSPIVTIPEIKAACQSQAKGLQKAAQILLAARNAVLVNLPAELVEKFRLMAVGAAITQDVENRGS